RRREKWGERKRPIATSAPDTIRDRGHRLERSGHSIRAFPLALPLARALLRFPLPSTRFEDAHPAVGTPRPKALRIRTRRGKTLWTSCRANAAAANFRFPAAAQLPVFRPERRPALSGAAPSVFPNPPRPMQFHR